MKIVYKTDNMGSKLVSPSLERVHIFAKWLIDLGINVTVRTLGSDISASCGQLIAKVVNRGKYESCIQN